MIKTVFLWMRKDNKSGAPPVGGGNGSIPRGTVSEDKINSSTPSSRPRDESVAIVSKRTLSQHVIDTTGAGPAKAL